MNIPTLKSLVFGSAISLGTLSINQCKSCITHSIKSFKMASDSVEFATIKKLHEDATAQLELKRKSLADSLNIMAIEKNH